MEGTINHLSQKQLIKDCDIDEETWTLTGTREELIAPFSEATALLLGSTYISSSLVSSAFEVLDKDLTSAGAALETVR